MVRLDVLVPSSLLSIGVSYFIVYRVLTIRSSTVRWMSALGMTILLSWLSLQIYTGAVRPFYAAFVIAIIWLLIQRRLMVRQPISTNYETMEVGG